MEFSGEGGKRERERERTLDTLIPGMRQDNCKKKRKSFAEKNFCEMRIKRDTYWKDFL